MKKRKQNIDINRLDKPFTDRYEAIRSVMNASSACMSREKWKTKQFFAAGNKPNYPIEMVLKKTTVRKGYECR
jgi:hypothetical protein